MASKPCTSYLGNEYDSQKEMCNCYNINQSTFRLRIKSGMSEEEALTLPLQNKRSCTDHLGNIFSSTEEKCKFYGINRNTYEKRIKSGWTEEKALTTALHASLECSCTDHLGNTFSSTKEKCNFYGITRSCYDHRIKSGWSEEEALTTHADQDIYSCTDHLGNVFSSTEEK